jgi:hypothetical protein
MADSVGGGFPRENIQHGHLHYSRETKTLWMYIGEDPRSETSWVSVFSQRPLDATKMTPNQRGSTWIDEDGSVKRWTGSHIIDSV